MLKLGNKSISGLFVGKKAATKAFLGQKLIWQKASGLPYDAEVEYLEFIPLTGLYFGIVPADTDKVILDLDISTLSSSGY